MYMAVNLTVRARCRQRFALVMGHWSWRTEMPPRTVEGCLRLAVHGLRLLSALSDAGTAVVKKYRKMSVSMPGTFRSCHQRVEHRENGRMAYRSAMLVLIGCSQVR